MVRQKILILLIISTLATVAIIPNAVAAAKIVNVSSGSMHSLALMDDGTVWSWGNNIWGELGTGTRGDAHATLYKVPIEDIKAVSACSFHSLALKSDGTVWQWGIVPNGDSASSSYNASPVRVECLSGITAISAGVNVNLALDRNGTVWAWGVNNDNELGDGTNEVRRTPVLVRDLDNVSRLGERGRFVIKNDGTVWAWGNNVLYNDGNDIIFGVLGDIAETPIISVPTQVGGLTDVKQITSEGEVTLYVKSDGSLWAWGTNYYGQLGDGSIKKSRPPEAKVTPVQAKVDGIVKVSTLKNHVLALKSDGTVWQWGRYIDRKTIWDDFGAPQPAAVSNLDNVVDISTGDDFDIVLKSDGSIWGWGQNNESELGSNNKIESSPVKIYDGQTGQAVTPTASASQYPGNSTPAVDHSMPGQSYDGVPAPGMDFGTLLIVAIVVLGVSKLSRRPNRKN